MTNKTKIETKNLLYGGFAIFIAGLVYFYVNNKTEEPKEIKAEFKNGYTVMKSFQTEEVKKKAQDYSSNDSIKVVNQASESNQPQEKIREELSKGKERKNLRSDSEKADISTNGRNYFLKPDLIAEKRNPNEKQIESDPTGFKLSSSSEMPWNGEFNPERLRVFTDKMGHAKYVLTGAIVTKLQSFDSSVEQIKSDLDLEVHYLAPHLGIAIFQAQKGQNLNEIESKLKTYPFVQNSYLELLGEGVKAQ